MKKANFRLIHFGLESAVPRNLRTIKKVAWRTERDKSLAAEKKFIHKIKSNTKKIQALGLDVSVSIIIGLPKQSKKQAEVTVDFVKNLKPAFYFHDYLTLYPGTPLFNARKKFGLDIISPKTVLPYKTKFTFDVTEVAMLPSAVQRNDILNSLTETAINFFIRKNSFLGDTIGVSVIFIKDSKLNIGDFIKKDKITLSPILFFLQDDGRNIKKYLYNLIQKEFPIINLLSLQRIVPDKKILINDTRVYGLIFITEIIERRRVDFQKLALFIFLPLSQLYRKEETIALNLGNENGERKVIFLTLNNHEDKINFEKLLIDTRPLKDLLRRNQAECYLVNQCQWSNRLCPLAEEKILFIDKKGKSSSCFNGKEIINMRFPISNYFKEIEKRRRCKSCPVNNVCAKCLFVFPFSEEEFCRIRRNGSTGKLLGMLEKCNNVLHTAEYLSRLDNN